MGFLGELFSHALGGNSSSAYSKNVFNWSEDEIKQFFENLKVSSLTPEEKFLIRDAIIHAPERQDGNISLWTINQHILKLARTTKRISENDRRGVMAALKASLHERDTNK